MADILQRQLTLLVVDLFVVAVEAVMVVDKLPQPQWPPQLVEQVAHIQPVQAELQERLLPQAVLVVLVLPVQLLLAEPAAAAAVH